MAIISNQNNFLCEKHLIFLDNNILLEGEENGTQITEANLPTEATVRKFLDNQFASDWFAEPEYNYSALLLDKDSPAPSGCYFMPVRQFFWESKTENEKQNCITSELGFLAARAHNLLMWRAKMRFCPTCTSGLHDDPKFTALKCIGCGRQFFPQIEPAIIVLVSKGDEILLARHVQRNQDIYSCIAGFVEAGESLEHCVAREVKEETSLNIKNIKYAGSQTWPFPDQLMLAFTAEYESGEIKVQEEELFEAKWFKRDALPAIPRPGSIAYNLIHGLFKR